MIVEEFDVDKTTLCSFVIGFMHETSDTFARDVDGFVADPRGITFLISSTPLGLPPVDASLVTVIEDFKDRTDALADDDTNWLRRMLLPDCPLILDLSTGKIKCSEFGGKNVALGRGASEEEGTAANATFFD